MFGEEIITRRCLITLQGGDKVSAKLSIPRPKRAIFPEVMEREFVECFNRSQPFMKNKAVAVHIMRN